MVGYGDAVNTEHGAQVKPERQDPLKELNAVLVVTLYSDGDTDSCHYTGSVVRILYAM